MASPWAWPYEKESRPALEFFRLFFFKKKKLDDRALAVKSDQSPTVIFFDHL